MYWHIDADIISLVIVIIVYICNHKLPEALEAEPDEAIRNRRFSRCIETAIGVSVVDIIASVVMETPVSSFVYHLCMTAYFVLVELIIVVWFLYVLAILYHKDEKSKRTISYSILIIYALYVVFACTNPWTSLIYSLGPNNEYSRGPLFGVMVVLFAIYTIAMFILILIRWKHIPKEFPRVVLLLTPIIIVCGIVFQLTISGLLLIIPSFMICLVLAFLFLQTMRVRNDMQMLQKLEMVAETDNLTGLFNRDGMYAMVKQTIVHSFGQNVVVLLADIDNLKQINDTLGHPEGDRCIKLFAEKLKKHFRLTDTVARYGGDEFLVFFTGNFEESIVSRGLQKLLDEFDTIRIGADNNIPIHGSIGATYGVVGKDSFETLLAQADVTLYHVKRNGKAGYAIYHEGMNNTATT